MSRIEIKHRRTGAILSILYSGKGELAAGVRRAVASGADLSDADLRRADLSDVDMSGALLSGADLSDALLSGADLRGADLRGADLRDADLSDADLSHADLSDALLSGADLRRADLRGALLRDADLSDALLSGTDLRGADLRGADLSDAVGYSPEAARMTDPAAHLPRPAPYDYAARAERYRLRHPDVPVVPALDRRILDLIDAGEGQLDMATWHACATTHCRAGWAITLAGERGKELEAKHGSYVAGAKIYQASTGRVPDFYARGERTIEDIRACAATE